MADLTFENAAQAVRLTDETNLSQIEAFSTALNAAKNGLITKSLIAGKTDAGNYLPVRVDENGNFITTALTGFGADFSFGDVTLAAIAKAFVRRTAYNEQSVNAQRSISSASAADTAAGTGARTVRIEYHAADGSGTFTTDVTLNGTTPVATGVSNICFIEKMTVLTAGSGGVNAGIITLFVNNAGGGGTIGTIAAGNNRTFWAHHYVPPGLTCNVTGISCSHNGTTVGSGGVFSLEATTIGVANAAAIQVSDFVRLYGQASTFLRTYQSPLKVVGPAKMYLYVTPETASSTVYRGSFDFFETV